MSTSSPGLLLLIALLLLVGLVVIVVTVFVLSSGRRRRVPPVMPPPGMPAAAPRPVPPPPVQAADFDATLMRPGPSAPAWQLTATAGADAGRAFPLGARAQIGRAPGNEVHINDAMASRTHALLEWRGSAYAISDLGSANGTLLNGARLAQPAMLKPGDVIQIGSTQLALGVSPAAAPAGPAMRAAPTGLPAGGPQPVAAAAPAAERGGCLTFQVLLYFIGWFVLFAIIAVAVYLYTKEPLAPAGVGLAALISLIFMVRRLSDSWHGQIVDIRTEKVYVPGDEDSPGEWEEQEYAYIQQPGRRSLRKMRTMGGWQVGDWIEKRRGETTIRVRRGG